MTMQQAAKNAAAIRNLADRLAAWGLTDPQQRAEHLIRQLTEDRWAPIEPAPPMRGRGASRAAIDAARELFEQTRRAKEQAR